MSERDDKKRQEILEHFTRRRDRFVNSTSIIGWREELRECYRVISGDQWTDAALKERKQKNKPYTVFNTLSPIVRAIAGYEIMNRSKIDYYPRSTNPEIATQLDIVSDAVAYIQDDSGFYTESSLASEDQITCGLGATESYFNYDNIEAPYGEMVEERIFPGFLMFDNEMRTRQLNRHARWCGHVEVVSREWLDDEIEDVLGEEAEEISKSGGARNYDFITFFGASSSNDNLDIIFHYQWKERQSVYRCKNPFKDVESIQDPQAKAFILNASGKMEEIFGVNLEDGTFILDAKQYRQWRKDIQAMTEQTGVPLESQGFKLTAFKYYRARIARDMVIDWQESWCQTGFTLVFKTGYYDEIQSCYYGVLRDTIPIIRALNEAVSDYISYLQSIPKGGMYAELTAFPDATEAQQTRANEQNITWLNEGGLNKIRQKETPQPIGGVVEFINYCQQSLFAAMGLSADFMGAVESGNMTAALYGKMMRQTRMVLAELFDSNRDYMRRKGKVFLDAVRVLVENSDGKILPRVSGGKDVNMYLAAEDIKQEYDIIVEERPMTDEERQERFNNMIELYAKAQNPALLMLAIEDAPLEEEQKQRALQALNPPPPPTDPVNTELLSSQSQLNSAQAAKLAAEAEKINIENQAKMQVIDSDIRNTESSTKLNLARAASELTPT
jgi:hypothetical protein